MRVVVGALIGAVLVLSAVVLQMSSTIKDMAALVVVHEQRLDLVQEFTADNAASTLSILKSLQDNAVRNEERIQYLETRVFP